MKMLYKYPQVAYPYDDLVAVNGERNQSQPEYELFDALKDTFLANRYFDVFIEYAKASPEDILCRITAINRGPDAAPIHILPHLWYRNRWSWELDGKREELRAIGPGAAEHLATPSLGDRWWYVRASDGQPVDLLFTENETNFKRIDNVPNKSPYVKDGINDAVVDGRTDAVNGKQGSKLAGHAHAVVPAGGTFSVECPLLADGTSPTLRRFRRRLRQPHRRSRRVLRRAPSADARRRRTTGRPAGLRRAALVEAVLSLRRLSLAQGRSDRSRRRPSRAGRAGIPVGRNCTTPT